MAYRCVRMVAEAAASVPLCTEDEALASLLARPLPDMDGASLLQSLHAHLQITGNAYLEAVSLADDEPPGDGSTALGMPAPAAADWIRATIAAWSPGLRSVEAASDVAASGRADRAGMAPARRCDPDADAATGTFRVATGGSD